MSMDEMEKSMVSSDHSFASVEFLDPDDPECTQLDENRLDAMSDSNQSGQSMY